MLIIHKLFIFLQSALKVYEQLSEEVEKLKVEKSETIAEYVLDPVLVITVQIMFFALELLVFINLLSFWRDFFSLFIFVLFFGKALCDTGFDKRYNSIIIIINVVIILKC